jgi:hypothetical protein
MTNFGKNPKFCRQVYWIKFINLELIWTKNLYVANSKLLTTEPQIVWEIIIKGYFESFTWTGVFSVRRRSNGPANGPKDSFSKSRMRAMT